jgi:hypothetical protein
VHINIKLDSRKIGRAGDANNSRDAKAGGNLSIRRDVNNSWDAATGTPEMLTTEKTT